jgi:hypothetical protein
MEVLTEQGLIIIIMSFLDNKNCCSESSVLNFGITNKYYLNILKSQNNFIMSKKKYYKLCENTKKLLNNNLEIICTNCNNIKSLNGLRMLIHECKNYECVIDSDLFNFYMKERGKSFFHFDTKDESDKFKLDCKFFYPKVILGNTCCSGNGLEVILKKDT